MPSTEEMRLWRSLLDRLRRGPGPRGEQYELYREVLAAAPGTPESLQAARLLLEGAMADADTNIADAQEVMRALKALAEDDLELAELLRPAE
jgi:hypothetical protein